MIIVGGKLVDRVDKVLVKEQLAQVLCARIAVAGIFARHVGPNGDVDVGGAGDVVAWEDGRELSHAS